MVTYSKANNNTYITIFLCQKKKRITFSCYEILPKNLDIHSSLNVFAEIIITNKICNMCRREEFRK